MQQLSFQLASHLRELRPVTVVAWRHGQWGLPIFFMHAFLKVLAGLLQGSISVLHIGDPALAALAWLPKLVGVPVMVTVHGLDISFPSPVYQAYLKLFFWRRMSTYVCISRHVADMVVDHQIDASLVQVIPVGIGEPQAAPADSVLQAQLGTAYPVLLTIGRMVERKGVEWFVSHVASEWLPRNPQAVLVIAGDGPRRSQIEAAVALHRLSSQVRVLGEVSERQKWWLLARADLVVMPNIRVDADVEGFGLVALEAASVGSYVLASDMEGLRDAITDGSNGKRVESANAGRWREALDQLTQDRIGLQDMGAVAQRFVAGRFSWNAMALRHHQLLQALESHAP